MKKNSSLIHKANYTLMMAVILVVTGTSAIHAGGLATSDLNYINDLIGGRATGLGGAYTAISDDPSGAFYNPAGLVFAFDNQISLSVNSYKKKNVTMDKAISGEPYNQQIESFYPSFFGVVQSLGPIKLGITIVNTNNEILRQADYFSGIQAKADDGVAYPATYNINYNLTDNTLLGGLSAAMFVSDSIAIGATVYGMKRSREQIANQIITFEKTSVTTYQLNNQYITETMWGLTGIFGIQVMPANTLSFGASVSYSKVLYHREINQLYYKDESAGGNINSQKPDGTYQFAYNRKIVDYSNSEVPLIFRGGFAWFPSKKFLVTADAIYHMGSRNFQTKVQDTINYAAGVEFFLTDSFPVRAGVFTNFANTPKIDPNKTNQEMNVDLYGASLSLSWQTKNSSITLSGFGQYGAGDSQVISNSTNVQKTTVMLYSIALTGSAKY